MHKARGCSKPATRPPTVNRFGVTAPDLLCPRVGCTLPEALGASVAGMGLAYTVGKAYLLGIVTSDRPFLRTPKCEDKPALVRSVMAVREEVLLLAGLWAAMLGTVIVHGFRRPEPALWLVGFCDIVVGYGLWVGCADVSLRLLLVRRPDA